MSLKKKYVDISDVRFGDRTYVEEHVLYINKNDLLTLCNDKIFKSVDIEIARPGEDCRITSVGDTIEPMVKLDDEDATFPGLLGTMKQAGTGESLCLRGLVVTETYETMKINGLFIDMSGPMAEYTPFSQKIHVVLVAVPTEGADVLTYVKTLRLASLKLAKYLAKAAEKCIPDDVVEYNLLHEDLVDVHGVHLPRIVYVMFNCNLELLQSSRTYGSDAMFTFPTLMNPNEILDGAIINMNHDQIINSTPTYTYQNHPLINELYSRHGKDLNFVGLIVASVNFKLEDKQRNVMVAFRLAKEELGADIILITKESGGHPQIECATLCDLAENNGVQVAMIQSEFAATSLGSDEALLFNTPNAQAIVSAGCLKSLYTPEPKRIIGHCVSFAPYNKTPLDKAGNFSIWHLRGAMSQVGDYEYKSFKY